MIFRLFLKLCFCWEINLVTLRLATPQMPVKIDPPIVQTQHVPVVETKMENEQSYSHIPPQLAAQGSKPVYGNPQLVMGPNGEMLQLISAPQAEPVVPQAPPPVSIPSTVYPEVGQHQNMQANYWSNTAGSFAQGKREKPDTTKKTESSSSEDGEMPVVAPPQRKRTVSAGSEK